MSKQKTIEHIEQYLAAYRRVKGCSPPCITITKVMRDKLGDELDYQPNGEITYHGHKIVVR